MSSSAGGVSGGAGTRGASSDEADSASASIALTPVTRSELTRPAERSMSSNCVCHASSRSPRKHQPSGQQKLRGSKGPCLVVYCSGPCVERVRPLKQSLEGLGATVHIQTQVECFVDGRDCCPSIVWSSPGSTGGLLHPSQVDRRPKGDSTGSQALEDSPVLPAPTNVPLSGESAGPQSDAQQGTPSSPDEAWEVVPAQVEMHCDAVLVLGSQYFHASLQHHLVEISERAGSKGAILLNDVRRLFDLQDRRWLLRELRERSIPTPPSAECSRDAGSNSSSSCRQHVEEHGDYIIVDGQRINKPFFEKPVDRRDREIYLYFPKEAGGGRAVIGSHESGDVDRSIRFDSTSRIRREGSFVYQEYAQSDGLVVQAVCVGGQAYGHAVHSGFFGMGPQPSQSHGGTASAAGVGAPVAAGLMSNAVAATGGCPVFLRQEEKLIAKNLSMVMRQTLFGITFARAHAAEKGRVKSLVLDVWPGVPRGGFGLFCDDVARALLSAMHQRLPLRGFPTRSRSVPQMLEEHHPDAESATAAALGRAAVASRASSRGRSAERRVEARDVEEDVLCLLLVCRHGDRTPKQKAKAKIQMPSEYAAGWLSGWLAGADVVAKCATAAPPDAFDLRSADQMARLHAAAMDFQAQGRPLGTFADALANFDRLGTLGDSCHAKLGHEGASVNVAIKWGGELTDLGVRTAESFGAAFRQNLCEDIDVGSVRHDMKVYSSREPRCQQTAAAFLRGFLRLHAPALPPIIAALVRKEESGLLDGGNGKNYTGRGGGEPDVCRGEGWDVSWADLQKLACTPPTHAALSAALASPPLLPFAGPRPAMKALIELVEQLIAGCEDDDMQDCLHNGETRALCRERYRDTLKELKLGETPESFEKVSRVSDHLFYDKEHNLQRLPQKARVALEAAFSLSEAMCDARTAIEVADRSRPEVARHDSCGLALLQKMRWDLRVASGADLGEEKAHVWKHEHLYASGGGAERPCVRTRLYFCHNSHVQGLLIALSRQHAVHAPAQAACGDPRATRNSPWDIVALRLGFLAHLALRLSRRRATGELRVVCLYGRSDRAGDCVQLFDLPLAEVDAWFTELLKIGEVEHP